MHDELLERRLRAVLRHEGDELPFTITEAELQRRFALRRRRTFSPRATLLLAAAVGIGALGVGGLLGGAIKPGPTATDPITAISSPLPSVTTVTSPLPTLDELMAGDPNNGAVLVAQAHDAVENRSELLQQPDGSASSVAFPVMDASGSYTVQIVCLGDSTLAYNISANGGSSPARTLTCDGTITGEQIDVDGPGSLVLFFREPVRWRVVVRGDPTPVLLPTAPPEPLTAEAGKEELVRLDDQTTDSSDEWGHTSLMLQEAPAVPGRFDYQVHIWCMPGEELRLILGDFLEGGADLTADTETYVRCDGRVMDLDLRMIHPSGSRVFVASAPGAHWSLLITSETPPVEVPDNEAGWQSSIGYGPSYAFEQHPVSFSNSGVEGGGPLLVQVECAGPAQRIEVTVDLFEPLAGKGKKFFADCEPGGIRTGQFFNTADVYSVTFTVPAGVWFAAAALIPTQ